MGKAMMTAAGVVAGIAIAGTVGVLMSNGRMKPRKIAKKTAKAMDNIGDAMQNAAKKANRYF